MTNRQIRQVRNLPNWLKEGCRRMPVKNTPQSGLTDKQRKIYQWIGRYIAQHGYSPTLREIAARFKISSLNGVACHLDALRSKGRVDWVDGCSRTLRVIGGDA